MMAWDDLDALEEHTYQRRALAKDGNAFWTMEAQTYENRLQRAEMGDDLDDY